MRERFAIAKVDDMPAPGPDNSGQHIAAQLAKLLRFGLEDDTATQTNAKLRSTRVTTIPILNFRRRFHHFFMFLTEAA